MERDDRTEVQAELNGTGNLGLWNLYSLVESPTTETHITSTGTHLERNRIKDVNTREPDPSEGLETNVKANQIERCPVCQAVNGHYIYTSPMRFDKIYRQR